MINFSRKTPVLPSHSVKHNLTIITSTVRVITNTFNLRISKRLITRSAFRNQWEIALHELAIKHRKGPKTKRIRVETQKNSLQKQ